MILDTSRLQTYYWRKRNGKTHKCFTTQTLYHLRCDSCEQEFTRTSKQLNKKSGTHVCNKCNQKRFAQTQSATWKRFKKFDASSGYKL